MPHNPLLLPLDPCASIEVTCCSNAGYQQRVTVTRVVNQKSHSESATFEGSGEDNTPMMTYQGKPSYCFEGGHELQLLCKFEHSPSSGNWRKSKLLCDPKVQDFGSTKQYTIGSEDAHDGDNDDAILTVTVHLNCQRIKLTILQGKFLIAKDRNLMGKKVTSDPYISFTINNNGQLHKTKVVHKSLHPEWNDDFDLMWPAKKPFEDIALQLLDHDLLSKDDSMGMVVIPRAFLSDGGSDQPQWFPVQTTPQCPKATGEVQVLVSTWNTTEPTSSTPAINSVDFSNGTSIPTYTYGATTANNTQTDARYLETTIMPPAENSYASPPTANDAHAGLPAIFRPT